MQPRTTSTDNDARMNDVYPSEVGVSAWDSQTPAGVTQADRRDLSAVTAQSLKQSRSGPDRRRRRFVPRRPRGLVAEPMLYGGRVTPADAAPSGPPRRGCFSTARSGDAEPPASFRRVPSRAGPHCLHAPLCAATLQHHSRQPTRIDERPGTPPRSLPPCAAGLPVPGMTHVTAGCARTYFSSSCDHVRQPSSAAHSGSAGPWSRLTSAPPPNGLFTIRQRRGRRRAAGAPCGFGFFERVVQLHEVERFGCA